MAVTIPCAQAMTLQDLKRFCIEEWLKIPSSVLPSLVKHYKNVSLLVQGDQKIHNVFQNGMYFLCTSHSCNIL